VQDYVIYSDIKYPVLRLIFVDYVMYSDIKYLVLRLIFVVLCSTIFSGNVLIISIPATDQPMHKHTVKLPPPHFLEWGSSDHVRIACHGGQLFMLILK